MHYLILLLAILLFSMALRNKPKVGYKKIVLFTTAIWASSFCLIAVIGLTYTLFREGFMAGFLAAMVRVLPSLLYWLAMSVPFIAIHSMVNCLLIKDDFSRSKKYVIPIVSFVLALFNTFFVLFSLTESYADIWEAWVLGLVNAIVIFLTAFYWTNREIEMNDKENGSDV